MLAAGPPSSRPPVSRAAGSEDSAAGNGGSGSQRAEAADQADQVLGKPTRTAKAATTNRARAGTSRARASNWTLPDRSPSLARRLPPLSGREHHTGNQEQDRHQRDYQGDQDVCGWPEAAAVVLEPHLLGMVVAVGSRGRLLTSYLKTLSGLVSQRSGMDRLLSTGVNGTASSRDHGGSSRPAGITMTFEASPLRSRPACGRGGRDPTPASKRGGCSAVAWLATCPRRSRCPSFAGIQADALLPSPTSCKPQCR